MTLHPWTSQVVCNECMRQKNCFLQHVLNFIFLSDSDLLSRGRWPGKFSFECCYLCSFLGSSEESDSFAAECRINGKCPRNGKRWKGGDFSLSLGICSFPGNVRSSYLQTDAEIIQSLSIGNNGTFFICHPPLSTRRSSLMWWWPGWDAVMLGLICKSSLVWYKSLPQVLRSCSKIS